VCVCVCVCVCVPLVPPSGEKLEKILLSENGTRQLADGEEVEECRERREEEAEGSVVHVEPVLHLCYGGVTVVLQWRYGGVTVVLQWSYSVVTELLQCCYSGVTVQGEAKGGGRGLRSARGTCVRVVLLWCYSGVTKVSQ
jgi:hypothetical protein